MTVFLDDQPLAVARPTLAAVIDAGRLAAQARGRVVIEVQRDGRSVDGSELDNPPETPEPGAEFRLLTAEPHALVRTTFMDVADMLPPAADLLARAAVGLQTGRIQDACADLAEAVNTFETVRAVIQQGPGLLGVGADELLAPAGGSPVSEQVTVLTSHLEALKTALAAQDWSTLADVLEGDLSDDARAWAEILGRLAEAVRARSAGARPGGGA